MAIKPDLKSVQKSLELLMEPVQILNEELVKSFSALGEGAVKKIRMKTKEESWTDRTGNLRSSIGYEVFNHGEKTANYVFEQVKEGTEGGKKGEELIDDLAKNYNNGVSLVMVAGMEYAEYVERKGYDVLAKTSLEAETLAPKAISKAIEETQKRLKGK